MSRALLKRYKRILLGIICVSLLNVIYLCYNQFMNNSLNKISVNSIEEYKPVFSKAQADDIEINVLVLRNKFSDSQLNLDEIVKVFSYLRKVKHSIEFVSNENFERQITRKPYTALIFESQTLYTSLSDSQKSALTHHCSHNQIGIIVFNISNIPKSQTIKCNLNSDQRFYYLTKFNTDLIEIYSSFEISSQDISKLAKPILTCNDGRTSVISYNSNKLNVREVFIAFNLNDSWIVKSLFIDALVYSSHGRFSFDLRRFIQIDIDDIFVGASGTRLLKDDIYELINFQNEFNNKYLSKEPSKQFKFNLGFSGYYFLNGNSSEDDADRLLIELKDNFNWFDHTWAHMKPHLFNESFIEEQLVKNREFAINHQLPALESHYSVSPHHSGIYPVYDTLYKKWKSIWNIRASSTEGYPHLRPAHLRRGFVHADIMVAPRQLCGIFTHHVRFDAYKGGKTKLIESTRFGELFDSILLHRVNIYMTHMTNYIQDRVALFLFRNLFELISKWTNLKLVSIEPVKTVEKYFELNPEEREPLWTNPCEDKKHTAIWHKNRSECEKIPKMIIIGPQKTGTTALHQFLKLHPLLRTSKPTNTFEEPQFFIDKNYFKGLEWYLDLFEPLENNSKVINFEKSANYFTDLKSMKRIKALIKDVRLVVLLLNPVDRAYSWYQHMIAHNDTTALKYTFNEVLINSNKNDENLRQLRNRCLQPGLYSKFLKKWIHEFTIQQFYFIDADDFKTKPHFYLNELQRFLTLPKPHLNYENVLVFNDKKGFYCHKDEIGSKKCLGKSKGRKYEEMNMEARSFLQKYYKKPNDDLKTLLLYFNQRLPNWL